MKSSLLALCLLFTTSTWAQNDVIRVKQGGEFFTFPNGILEWSQPIDITVTGRKLEKKGQAPVSLSVRIKLKKKFVLACHFEVEITNKDTRSVQLSVYNDYRMVGTASAANQFKGNYIYHKYKLKPGASKVQKIIWADPSCKPNGDEGCLTGACGWHLMYADVSAK